jgi:catechol 2,3-dioxygenase-like lactoylglutathione lyase family enzyme
LRVIRIVANVATPDTELARSFYGDLLGLDVVMNQGRIATFATTVIGRQQISFASEGGSGTAVPDLSIEFDNVEALYERTRAMGFDIVYPLTDKPWGVRRFYARDPFGRVVNILSHIT